MHRLKTYPFILLSLILGITSCNDDEADYSGAVKTIQSQIDEGDLLKEYILDEDNYVLTFETKTVNIPSSVVEKIVTDEDKWESILTFSNGNTYYIPTLGSSVESLITNLEVNPSGYNPLAAQAVMNLPVLGHIKLIVHSKEGAKTPDVEHLFSSIEKGQTIPILGLYANYENQVTLIYTDKEGHERASSTIEVKTGSIKDIFLPQNLRVVTVDVSRMEPGMTLVNSPGQSDEDTSVPYMFDADGEIRWVLDWRNHPELKHIGFHCGLKRMQNGNYLAGDVNNGQIVEVDLLGNLVNAEAALGKETYTLDDLFSALNKSAWSELSSGKSPDVYRRSLQNLYVERLLSLLPSGTASAGSGMEAVARVQYELRTLQGRLERASAAEPAVKAHYQYLAKRIKEKLDPK